MNAEKNSSTSSGTIRRMSSRRRYCKFCAHRKFPLTYKQPQILSEFITERGKIIPRRISGNCARHQRRLTKEIKRARVLAFLPYTITRKGMNLK